MQAPIKLASPPQKPVLIFDGDCTFCSLWVRRWLYHTGERIEYLPFQSEAVTSRFPELKMERLRHSVHLVQSDGSVFYGAEAALRALHSKEQPSWLCRGYSASRSLALLMESCYRFVADHRPFFSVLTRVFWGTVEPASYVLTRSIFIRSLGLIYLIAFISLWTQINGLIGSRGILPAADTMEALHGHADSAAIHLDRYRIFPTLCWFDSSDRSLALQCAIGTVLALLVVVGMAPAPCLFLLWVIYLSLCTISREFLSFQWDILLLETGFLTIFLSPVLYLPWRTATARKVPLLIIWLLRWLLFRLMWESGRVKLLSHDETWANLTALTFHYETQPLPTWIGWYAHQFPAWIQKASCFLMLRIELDLPFLIFTPRRIRHWVAVIFIALQTAIFLTGNYCFFNLLTIVLCFALFDDHALRTGYRRVAQLLLRPFNRSLPPSANAGTVRTSGRQRWMSTASVSLQCAVACLVLLLTIPQVWNMFGEHSPRHAEDDRTFVLAVQEWFVPLRTFNTYGLFAVMTRPRYEIIVQGSNDGEKWLDYEFKYKPGKPRRRPEFVAPHQPRLDWQMWFAALGTCRENPWFIQFCGRILQDSPEVLSLLKTNPFPNGPPKYIHAILYEYHFTDPTTRRLTREWWRRDLKGEYLPVLSLRKDAR